ncbi:MAG: AAA family ATPase [Candidatus Poribacteria bacterium]|nr:AAA family ATPase [Candidatus Poribacteria bacterium]
MSNINDIQQPPKVDISVKNFGPISEANIDLRPLTVFIGPSNTGKTYFSTQIYALHSIFNGFSESGFLSPFGPTGFMGLIAGNEPERGILLDSTITAEEHRELTEKFLMDQKPFKLSDLSTRMQNQLRALIKKSEIFRDPLQEELKNCFDLDSILALIRLTGEQHNEMSVSLKVSKDNQECWKINLKVSESVIAVDGSASEGMHLLPKGWSITSNTSAHEKGPGVFVSHPWPNWMKRNRYYLPAARSGIMQSHRVIASSLVKRTSRVGLERFPEVPTLSGVITEFMQQIILYEEERVSNSEMKDIAAALESDVLAGQIHVKASPSGYPDFRYRPHNTKEDMRLSQASSMVSELAPLVLFIRGLIHPGDTLIIEEPEAHLHPGAQTAIAATLARLVRAGVRVVVTTHSDWLLKEIGNLIREGVLNEKGELRKKSDGSESWLLPDEVGAWHFHKEKPVERLHFTNIDGIEPSDYEDLAQDLYNRSAGLHNQLAETEGNNTSE